MKKSVKKINKKESEFEMLARLVSNGFHNVDKKFDDVNKRFDDVNKKFESVDRRFDDVNKRFDSVDKRFEEVDTQLSSINHELRDHSVRLERIERKQMGLLASLDESVHRSEFKSLSSRVDALEKKTVRK